MQSNNSTTLTGFEPFDVNPEFYHYVMQQATVRLDGKENNKNRPYLGLKSVISNVAFTVKPSLSISASGWVLDGGIAVMIPVRTENSKGRLQDFKMKYWLTSDGTAKPMQSWSKNPALTENSKEALLAYINMIASDPHRYIPLLNADHCGICGKYLSDPESRSVGIGPECIKSFRAMVKLAGEDLGNVIDGIKELRRKMQQAHPDKGGDVDVFISLRKEFERLREVA